MMQVIDIAAVVIIGPNVLRTFCLHFVSSNMHQTQVLNPWWLWPSQAFCFKFGSTHGIHHLVVKEPFYIRQMTAKVAHEVMTQMGSASMTSARLPGPIGLSATRAHPPGGSIRLKR